MTEEERAMHDKCLDEQKRGRMAHWTKSEQKTERYHLTMPSAGVYAYGLKPGMEQDEPPHLLCANCFTQSEKSILQFSQDKQSAIGSCPRCKNDIHLRHDDAQSLFRVG
jgi:hypothetical protein